MKLKILLLFLLLAAGNMQADIRTVVNTKTDNTEGSFFYIASSLQDGDTITFDNTLAGQTITLTESKYINLSGGRLTVIGNGVTFSGGQLYFSTGSLWIENVRFKDNLIVSFTAGTVRVRNCTFSVTQEGDDLYWMEESPDVLATGSSVIENCAFMSEDTQKRRYVRLGLSGDALLTSCTFYKQAYEVDEWGYYSRWSLISNANGNVEMTNCVVMDCSTENATFGTPSKLRSRGYNVILQSSESPLTALTTIHGASGDVILTQTDALPLTFDEGIWKVPLASPAYRHLPPKSVLDENEALQNVVFHGKDLSGAGIDYTCKTHSGAWQTVYLENGENETEPECGSVTVSATSITLTPPAGTIYTAPSAAIHTISARVEPVSEGVSQAVTWTSSDPDVATVATDEINTCRITPLAAGTTTITAISTATPSVKQTVEIEVHDYIHVDGITLKEGGTQQYATPVDTIRSVHHLEYRIHAIFSPANALNPAITWELEDPDGVVNETHPANSNLCILKGTKAGTAKLIARATDEGNGIITDTCVLEFTDPHYTDGVFMLTEGNYPGQGTLNFLYPDGKWEYNIYLGLNNPPTPGVGNTRTFGVTSQHGAIYGGKFYVVSKQGKIKNNEAGPHLVVFDPVTMELHREFWNLPAGNGRCFLGVDEKTGYISTNDGIHVFDLENLCNIPGGHRGVDKAVETLPTTIIEGTRSGSHLYTGQIGTMIRVGERVFAVSQSEGIVVINARTHTIETTLKTNKYAVLTQSLDGYLWAGATVTESTGQPGTPSEEEGQAGLVDNVATYNALIRIDPWTLEEKAFPLPDGIGAPPSTWAAWQADPLCGSPKDNALYWKDGSKRIHRYDIATNQVTTVFNTANYPVPQEHNNIVNGVAPNWNMYGPSFRIHPTTGDLYVWITLFHLQAPFEQRQVWDVYRINPNTGEQLGHYPLKNTYWWPSMFVFPDNAAPVVSAAFPTTVTLNAAHRYDTLALRPLVSDADQMASAIVKTIEAVGDPTLVDAFIRHDSLFITPLKEVASQQTTTVALKFNSNGKVETRNLSVDVQPGAIAHPVTGVSLNFTAKELPVGQTLALTATVEPANADNPAVTWTSSASNIASVDNNGVVTAHLAPSRAVITATTVQGGFTATCVVTTQAAGASTVAVTGVAVSPSTATVAAGATLQLTASVQPGNATNRTVVWSSSNASVATVSSAGLVTALSANGTADITAKTADGGFTATCRVTTTATNPIETNPFELNQRTLTLYPGQTVTLGLTAPQHFDVTWSSSVPSVATVSQAGEVRSLSAGTTVVIARDVAKGKVDMCTVTVLPIPASTVESVELNTSLLTLTQGETATLQVTTSAGLIGEPRTWSASNPNVADVTASGTVITFAPGTCVIRVAIGNYSAMCTVQVSAPRQNTEVDNITQNSAQLFLSKNAVASYYLVHLYTKLDVSLIPVYTLKVTPDGSVTFVTLRAGVNNLVVPLQYLSPATPYIMEVEAIQELQGKANVIHTEISAFTTASATGLEDVADGQPKAWYANGTLRLEHLDGYVCTVMSMSGQAAYLFRVATPDDRRRIQLQQGTYVLSAQKDGTRKVFKFVVF